MNGVAVIIHNMRLGIIYCCYGNPEYINDCLAPWLEAKKSHNILISAVHGQFKEYHDLGIPDNDLETIRILSILNREGNKIDNLYIQNHYTGFSHWQTEAEIRDKGLQWLLKQNCDVIWLLDNDERYTVEQINNIIEYINRAENRDICWFSIPFKNYVLDGKSWIDNFAPPRIFRINYKDYELVRFFWDNDVSYLNKNFKKEQVYYKYDNFPNKLISKEISFVKHLTWLHSNGREKYEYQMKHFGHCGYKWNYETNLLEINYDFYRKIGQNPPIIYKDE